MKKRLRKKRNFIKKNKPLMLTICIVVIVLLSVTVMYSSVAGLDKKILAQQSEISDLKKTKMTLIGDVMGIKSSAQIQREAMYKLGMIFPDKTQIVYIDMNKEKEKQDVNYNVFLNPIISVLRSYTK